MYQNGLAELGTIIAAMLLSGDVFIKKSVWLFSIDLMAVLFVFLRDITIDVINSKLV